MKISEAIHRLQELLETEGDLQLVHVESVDEAFYVEWGRVFEPLGVPIDDTKAEVEVVAFLSPQIIDDGEPEEEKPKLKLVKG